MKIAVTGASGHIGNNLCRALLAKGHQLKVMINKSEKSINGLDVDKIYGNILDVDMVNSLIKDADYVFHAAALISIGNESSGKVFKINTVGTKNVVDACMKYKIKRLIHFSSIHALKSTNPNQTLNENNPLTDIKSKNYDGSKAMGEEIVMEACKNGLNAIILNPSSVVGPYDFMPSLVGQMLIKIANNKLPFLIKGGYHFVDVRDVVDAAINAIHMGSSGQRYLLTSEWKSLLEIARLICSRSSKKMPVKTPTLLAWFGLPFIFLFAKIYNRKELYTRESLRIISHSPKLVENKKAIEELQFKPRPAIDTFNDAYNWFLKNNYIV